MPNLTDLPHELHLHLLPFLDYPSYYMLRATNHYFRSLNLKARLVVDKLIQLELSSANVNALLTERSLMPCYWCPSNTSETFGPGALLPLNRFRQGTKIMTTEPECSSDFLHLDYRMCIDCEGSSYGYLPAGKGSSGQGQDLSVFGLQCVEGDCRHCLRKVQKIDKRLVRGSWDAFLNGKFTGCRIRGYCWTCREGPRPDSNSSPTQMWRRECDDCFNKWLGRNAPRGNGEAESLSAESKMK